MILAFVFQNVNSWRSEGYSFEIFYSSSVKIVPPKKQNKTNQIHVPISCICLSFQQWKKRFFVLRKPSGSLPDQYELHYYKDQRCNTKKGSIDLEQCEQIIEALDSDVFPYLLAIKTYYKNKVSELCMLFIYLFNSYIGVEIMLKDTWW